MVPFEERKGFTFFRSYYESAIKLSDRQRLVMYDSIVKYSFEGDTLAFDRTDDELVNAILLLIKPTLDKSIKRSIAGTKGSKSNCQSHLNTATDNVELNNMQRLSKTKPKLIHRSSKQKSNENQIVGDNSIDIVPRDSQPAGCISSDTKQQDFNKFWNAYPKKVGKVATKKIWDRIKPSVDLQSTILDALVQQKISSQWQSNNGQFIPNPSTWLNGHRWDDVLPKHTSNFKFNDYPQRHYPEDAFDKYISSDFGNPMEN